MAIMVLCFYGFMVLKVSFVENVVATKYPENIFPIFLNRIWQRCKCFFLAVQIYSSLFWKNAFCYHFKNGFTAWNIILFTVFKKIFGIENFFSILNVLFQFWNFFVDSKYYPFWKNFFHDLFRLSYYRIFP